MKELLLSTCIAYIDITLVMTKRWGIEYFYLGQRLSVGVSLLFAYHS